MKQPAVAKQHLTRIRYFPFATTGQTQFAEAGVAAGGEPGVQQTISPAANMASLFQSTQTANPCE